MRTIAVTGAGSGLGRRVAAAAPDAVLVDADESVDLKPALEGMEAVVTMGSEPVEVVRRVLDAAGDAGVRHLVHLSSATVYGAWPDNPVPLTEDAPVRPNPGFDVAASHAEAERLVAEWKDAHPGATAAVLRPAVVVGAGADRELARALAGTTGLRPAEAARPIQYVHEDDLVQAILVALRHRLDGPYNVAPEGWVSDETARALAGGTARLALPERLARPLLAAGRLLGVDRSWPGVAPYQRHPWVVAADRLHAAGWRPSHTNEEAYVLSGEGSKLEISPRRRQEVALGAGVALLAGAVAGVVALVRRRRR
ncbi:MAG TPA: NAD-dependent epimerase/dehydratase family protein [Acidimicrobiales bacterium]|nr:NAD-dependent epimerase/dehydratase family protein [Acidimicrobiales bacterium]